MGFWVGGMRTTPGVSRVQDVAACGGPIGTSGPQAIQIHVPGPQKYAKSWRGLGSLFCMLLGFRY